MLALQKFQYEFGRHVRDPRRQRRPDGVPARRIAIYSELLYNNLEGFLLACFPLTRQIIGDRRWPGVVRAFFREARCQTPYFREIPREFLAWLGTRQVVPGPVWLTELAHYEWVELALDVMETNAVAHDPQGDLLAGIPVFAPARMNLAYTWPVHRIAPQFRPSKPRQTHLLVFRDESDVVQFIELNPVTARLVDLLLDGGLTGHAACCQIAAELGREDIDNLLAGGADVLCQLRQSGAILGIDV
jgi:hypothetical protein